MKLTFHTTPEEVLGELHPIYKYEILIRLLLEFKHEISEEDLEAAKTILEVARTKYKISNLSVYGTGIPLEDLKMLDLLEDH